MKPPDDRIYFGHMLDVALAVEKLITGVSLSGFLQDETLRIAVAHQIQVIGEAARRISAAGVASIDLNWSEIIGMRHKIVHDYMGIDFDLIWQTAIEDIPGLIAILTELLSDQSS